MVTSIGSELVPPRRIESSHGTRDMTPDPQPLASRLTMLAVPELKMPAKYVLAWLQ
jgi:hypothetical protein